MQFRHIAAAAAAAIALSAAGSASAVVTQLTFTNATTPSTGAQIYFNGLSSNKTDPYAGLSSTFVLTLQNISNGGYTWNFSYELANTSTVDSRVSVIGWDLSSHYTKNSTASGLFGNYSSGQMSFAGDKEFCLKSPGGNNCSGGGGGGVADGATGAGAFSLNFASQQLLGYHTEMVKKGNKLVPVQVADYGAVAAPTSLTFNDFGIHYQSVPILGSTIGVPGVPPHDPLGAVPEPETWAMLILGFFGMGAVVRRRSVAVRAA